VVDELFCCDVFCDLFFDVVYGVLDLEFVGVNFERLKSGVYGG
jgi:hypothetical protein